MQFSKKFSRRQFGQLAIASSTLVGLGYFATKTLAQTTAKTAVTAETGTLTTVLLGVFPTAANNNNQSQALTSDSSQPIDSTNDNSRLIEPSDSGDGTEAFTATATATSTVGSTAIVEPAPELVVNSLDLTTGLTSASSSTSTSIGLSLNGDVSSLQPYKQVSGLAALSGGKIVVATNPIDVNQKGNPTRITVTQGNSIKTLDVSGLKKQDMLASLAGTNTDQLFGLVVDSSGKSKARLVAIDINTGQIDYTEKLKLPENERFATLTQCSDGTMYTTSVAQSGLTSLVQLDLSQKKPITLAQLSLDGNPWVSGLKGLACSGAGQIYALGSGRYEITNSLFLIDAKTGKMTRLREFQAVNVTFVRA